MWTVCLRQLPDIVAAAIWTRALLRLSPARWPLGNVNFQNWFQCSHCSGRDLGLGWVSALRGRTILDAYQRWTLRPVRHSRPTSIQRVNSCRPDLQQKICLWKSHSIPIPTKIRLMKALVWPVATYGCESWTLRKNEETCLDAFEMKGLSKILRVSWTAMETNERVLNNARVKRELLDTVKARKLAYYGHTMRKQGSCVEKEIMQGTMPGARRRGRPRTAWMDNIKTWTGLFVHGRVNHNDRGQD